MSPSWKFYLNSKDAWDAMLVAVRSATVSIDLEQFILYTDEIGNEFITLCQEKAKQGVRVRILCDAAGSFGLYGSLVPNLLEESGVKIAFFNTFIPGVGNNHTPWLFRDHRKMLVVDSTVAFTGGICLGEAMRSWRDTHVELRGEVVAEMEYEFNRMWSYAHKRRFRSRFKKPAATEGYHYVPNLPLPRRRYLYYTLIEAIRGARHYVYLTTPYFVPDRRLFRVLSLAALRGVDVRILIPRTSDNHIVDVAAHTHFAHVLKAGVKIHRYTGSMIHAKTAVIDDEWATVGSLNLDNVSLRYNFEGNIVSTDKKFAAELKSHFLKDLPQSKELTQEVWEKRGIIQKLKEILVRPIRWFL
ncbi:MAG TPA: phospholipase D-like domain-containing protein [Candidatus Paceibacterota bacterium]